MNLLDTLTAEQRAAALAQGPCVVVDAGPGSGKTRLLAARVQALIARGIAPEEIRVFVFTRTARDELAHRLAEACAEGVARRVQLYTFHGFALRIFLAVRQLRGLPSLQVADQLVAEQMLDDMYDPTKALSCLPRGFPRRRAFEDLLTAYESDVVDAAGFKFLDLVIDRFRRAGLVPTWALTPFAARAVSPSELEVLDTTARHYQKRPFSVPWVLVDEAQDVTPNELLLIDATTEPYGSRFFVGDPRQAIFCWRGALGRIAVPGADRFTLTRTFRFGGEIAAAANAVARAIEAEPIVGGVELDDVVDYRPGAWATADLNDAIAAFPRHETAILCRDHETCAAIAADLGPVAIHVRKDRLHFDEEPIDWFAEARATDRIAVATVHAAKGREWGHVVVAPSRRFPTRSPEELRVLYVALTRARRRLTVAWLAPAGRAALESRTPKETSPCGT